MSKNPNSQRIPDRTGPLRKPATTTHRAHPHGTQPFPSLASDTHQTTTPAEFVERIDGILREKSLIQPTKLFSRTHRLLPPDGAKNRRTTTAPPRTVFSKSLIFFNISTRLILRNASRALERTRFAGPRTVPKRPVRVTPWSLPAQERCHACHLRRCSGVAQALLRRWDWGTHVLTRRSRRSSRSQERTARPPTVPSRRLSAVRYGEGIAPTETGLLHARRAVHFPLACPSPCAYYRPPCLLCSSSTTKRK